MFINKIRVFEQSCKRLFIPVLMCYISLIVVDTSKINVDWVVTYSNSFWSFARDAFKIANDKRHQIRAHLHALLKVIRAKFDHVIALKQTAKSNLNFTQQLHIKDVTQTKEGKFDSRTKCSTLPDGAYPQGGGRREAGGGRREAGGGRREGTSIDQNRSKPTLVK